METTIKALTKVVPDLERIAFTGKDLTSEEMMMTRSYIAMWSLASEIDGDITRLKEMAESLSRRFAMYAEAMTRSGPGEAGLDLPTRSSYVFDMTEAHSRVTAKFQTLLTLTSLTCGREVRTALEKEIGR